MTPCLFPRRALAGLALAAAVSAEAGAAGPVSLFTVVGPRDEIVVGLTPAELPALHGPGGAEALFRKIAADGQMTVWRYAVRRGDNGALVMAPLARIGLFAAGVARIEPYAPAHPVVAPR